MPVFSRISLYVKGSFGIRTAKAFKVPKIYSGKFAKALKEAIGHHIERTEVKPVPKSKEGHESKYILISVTVYVHRLELLKETAKRIFADLERAEKEKMEEEARKRAEAVARMAQKKKGKGKKKTVSSNGHSVGTNVKTVRLRSR